MDYPERYTQFGFAEADRLMNSLLGRAEALFEVAYALKQIHGPDADDINNGVTSELLSSEPLKWVISRNGGQQDFTPQVIIGFSTAPLLFPEISFRRTKTDNGNTLVRAAIDTTIIEGTPVTTFTQSVGNQFDFYRRYIARA
jgi:hypothetical protein